MDTLNVASRRDPLVAFGELYLHADELHLPTDTDWIETYTGRQFWPLRPRIEDVCIEDIAHALGNKCRFTGHCNPFYSVAEHSWIVSYEVPAELAREGLLHDGPEAYLPDVAAPIKPHLTGFKAIESRVDRVIRHRYGLQLIHSAVVKEIDRRMVVTERGQIMSPSSRDWKTHEGVQPLAVRIQCWDPSYAAFRFLDRAKELGIQ